MTQHSIAIIGAGVTGLTAAKRLIKLGHSATVFDASVAGGLASGFPFPGTQTVWLEKFYHHIFKTDTHIVDLIDELGLSNDLMWLHSRSGLFHGDRVWPLEGPIDLLKLKPVGSIIDRLKMGLGLRVFQKEPDWTKFDSITCEEFFRQRNALRAYKGMWEPLLKAKFGEAYARIPAAFLWGRIYPRSRSREKGRESLGYLRGGFPRMIQAWVEKLQREGVHFQFDTRVNRIERVEDRFRIHTSRGEQMFDRIIWTGHPSYLLKVLDNPEPQLLARLKPIEYIAACCMVLVLKQQIGEFYWVNNLDPSVTFGGSIEHTNLVPPEYYNGRHIMYVINYLNPEHPYMKMELDELFRTHLPSLKKVHPKFDEALIEQKYLFKGPAASPLYDVGFRQKMPPFHGLSKGIAVLGMSQVYPIDRNMNHCVQVGLEADVEGFVNEG